MDATIDQPQPDAPATPRPRSLPVLVGLLVFALAVAAVFAYLWATKAGDVTAGEVETYLDARKDAVTERATEVMSLMLTYDSTNIDEVSEQVLELATGDFRDDYAALVGGGNLKRALRRSSSSSRGQIIGDPDVAFRAPNEAVVIVTVTQTAQSRENPAGTTTDYVMRVVMLHTGGEWKADGVDVLSEQAV
ncbi:MAG TPA: hypothetical protein VG318_06080 [Actinomycetota bacterium]|nr:hypothetical protein [Actinomycetota bacterium]